MAYAQDTIISANAANVFALVLDGLLIDAGWTVVETLTPAGTFTPTTKVYKSAAADNQCGYDWYIALMWKAVGTEAQVRIIAGGAYDQPTHLISQIPADVKPVNAGNSGGPGYYAAAVTGDMWGAYNVNQATNTATTVTSVRSGTLGQTWPFFSVIVPSSAFGYWASVTLDHFGVFTTIPGSYFASTLDLDADWVALDATFGNGVATNPVVAFTQNSAPSNNDYQGISALVKGPTGTPSTTLRLSPVANRARPYGVELPAIDGPYLDAYAWRDAWYLTGLSFQSSPSVGGTPTWVSTLPGTTHIGDGIDYYMVFGGSIGDTVEIDGATYVLSGRMTGVAGPNQDPSSYLGAWVAVLVEP